MERSAGECYKIYLLLLHEKCSHLKKQANKQKEKRSKALIHKVSSHTSILGSLIVQQKTKSLHLIYPRHL